MDDSDETTVLRQLTLNAVAQCNDPELLDLVYKILISDILQ
jgi:hypothetical protein